MPKPINVFISVDDDDSAVAKKFYRNLKDKGVSPFLEQVDLLPGQHRENTVNRAIRESDFFIALLSSRSVGKRGFIQKRLKTGIRTFEEFCDTDVFMIPVRLDDCELPDAMAALTHVDIFPSYTDCLSKILQTLNAGDRKAVASKVEDRNRTEQIEPASGTDSAAGSDLQADPPNEIGRHAPPTAGGSDMKKPDAAAGGQHSDNRRPSQPMSPMAYAIISLASFLFGVGLLLLYIFKAEDLVAQGIDARVYYVLTIPLGLCSAGFLFGVMRSYAIYSGKALGGAYELGGPAVIAIAVVIGGFLLAPADVKNLEGIAEPQLDEKQEKEKVNIIINLKGNDMDKLLRGIELNRFAVVFVLWQLIVIIEVKSNMVAIAI